MRKAASSMLSREAASSTHSRKAASKTANKIHCALYARENGISITIYLQLKPFLFLCLIDTIRNYNAIHP